MVAPFDQSLEIDAVADTVHKRHQRHVVHDLEMLRQLANSLLCFLTLGAAEGATAQVFFRRMHSKISSIKTPKGTRVAFLQQAVWMRGPDMLDEGPVCIEPPKAFLARITLSQQRRAQF